MKYIVEFEDEPCMYEDEVHFYKCIQAPWWGLSERVIEQLTPYQPDHTADVSKKVSISCAHENDVIFRQAAIEAMGRATWAKERLEELPPAQPDIIRCKDCKYMIDIGDDLMCDNAKGWVVATTSDFGCVLAERRTE